jgi:hypothetical protein
MDALKFLALLCYLIGTGLFLLAGLNVPSPPAPWYARGWLGAFFVMLGWLLVAGPTLVH